MNIIKTIEKDLKNKRKIIDSIIEFGDLELILSSETFRLYNDMIEDISVLLNTDRLDYKKSLIEKIKIKDRLLIVRVKNDTPHKIGGETYRYSLKDYIVDEKTFPDILSYLNIYKFIKSNITNKPKKQEPILEYYGNVANFKTRFILRYLDKSHEFSGGVTDRECNLIVDEILKSWGVDFTHEDCIDKNMTL